MSIDKVVIQGAEFTRVGERYLLQSEVERALAHAAEGSSRHVERLGNLLEDMVSLADRLMMETFQRREGKASLAGKRHREALERLQNELRVQITAIDRYLEGGMD